MSVATVLNRPAGFMLETLRVIREGIAKPTKVTRPIRPLEVRAALLSRRSSISRWANDHGYHRTQISKALHGHRTDRRSREILAALKKEINQ